MPIRLGTATPTRLYFGTAQVSRAYLGTSLVYQDNSLFVDPVIQAIANQLPFVPVNRREAVKASAEFAANGGNVLDVITLIASGNVCVSARLGDGCLHTGSNRNSEAIAAGDSVQTLWNWNGNTTFLSQPNAGLRGVTTSTAGLRLDFRCSYSGTPFSGWTTGERLFVLRADQDPAVMGLGASDAFSGISLDDAQARLGGGYHPWSDGEIHDAWGIGQNPTGFFASNKWNPIVNLASAFYILRSTAISTTQRFSQVNLELERSNTTAYSPSFVQFYAYGIATANGNPSNALFFWARSLVLSTSDRLTMRRFLSHYCNLGLF